MARRGAGPATARTSRAAGAGVPRFHWLRLRATAHATEDPERVGEALRFVAGFDPEAFAPLVQRSAVDAHHGGAVVVLEAVLTRSRDIRAVLERVLAAAPPAALLAQVDARTDDDGVFYLRVEKQAAFLGRLEPTTGEDAVQLRLKPEVHPARRDNAVAALRAWLTQAAGRSVDAPVEVPAGGPVPADAPGPAPDPAAPGSVGADGSRGPDDTGGTF